MLRKRGGECIALVAPFQPCRQARRDLRTNLPLERREDNVAQQAVWGFAACQLSLQKRDLGGMRHAKRSHNFV